MGYFVDSGASHSLHHLSTGGREIPLSIGNTFQNMQRCRSWFSPYLGWCPRRSAIATNLYIRPKVRSHPSPSFARSCTPKSVQARRTVPALVVPPQRLHAAGRVTSCKSACRSVGQPACSAGQMKWCEQSCVVHFPVNNCPS